MLRPRIIAFVGFVLSVAAVTAGAVDSPDYGTPTNGVATIVPLSNSGVKGTILLLQQEDHVLVTGVISGLSPGAHGFHIHALGDLRSADGTSAGDHFNPAGHTHGAPEAAERHAGDLGNIAADRRGIADFDLKVRGVTLAQLLGRSFVVHQNADDLKTQPAGNAGPRIAAGVIGLAQSTPLVAPPQAPRKVNINTATLAELQNLPGFDAAMGTHIWVNRPYRSLDDLSRDGVPLNVIDKIRDLVTFGQ